MKVVRAYRDRTEEVFQPLFDNLMSQIKDHVNPQREVTPKKARAIAAFYKVDAEKNLYWFMLNKEKEDLDYIAQRKADHPVFNHVPKQHLTLVK